MKLVVSLFLFTIGISQMELAGQNRHYLEGVRPIQVSLVPPLSSNGFRSGRYTNHFSLNLVAGMSGGVHGVEIAGFANGVLGKMHGLQIAGFANSVSGKTDGVQIAGFANFNRESVVGAQFAGFSNMVKEGVCGAQFAGFANRVNGNLKGAQFAGFSNISQGSMVGFQAAGFSNISSSVHGVQIAGFSNLNKARVEGLQIAGFYNQTKYLKGVQIGIVNVVDSLESGATIGLLNLVRNGYRALEFETSPTLYASVNFKTGTDGFYNIYGLSVAPSGGDFTWAYGLGFGSRIQMAKQLHLNLEGMVHHVHEDRVWQQKMNLLNRLKVNVSYAFGNGMEVYLGPVANLQITHRFDNRRRSVASELAPYDGVTWTTRNNITHLYFGGTAGLRIPILQSK